MKGFLRKILCKHKNSEVICWHWTHGPNGNDIRFLEIQRIYAEAWLECMRSEGKCGSNTVYMPFEAVQTTGANIRMFQK